VTTHFSGHLREGSLRNSQEAARQNVRSLSAFLLPTGSGTTFVGPFRAVAGTWTQSYQTGPVVRVRRSAAAANDNPAYQMIFTAGDLGVNVSTDTADAQQLEQTRGARITSLDLVYQLTTAGPLDAHVGTLDTLTWADAAAIPSAVNRPITGTLAVAVVATVNVTRLTVTTPFILTSLMQAVLSVRVDGDAGAAVLYDFWGLGVNYDLYM
jgi:hypothetical protein